MFNLARAIKSLVGCFTSSFVVVGTHVGSQSFAESKLSKTAFFVFLCWFVCFEGSGERRGFVHIYSFLTLIHR